MHGCRPGLWQGGDLCKVIAREKRRPSGLGGGCVMGWSCCRGRAAGVRQVLNLKMEMMQRVRPNRCMAWKSAFGRFTLQAFSSRNCPRLASIGYLPQTWPQPLPVGTARSKLDVRTDGLTFRNMATISSYGAPAPGQLQTAAAIGFLASRSRANQRERARSVLQPDVGPGEPGRYRCARTRWR